eukprot:scaffold38150_cov65-Phaeocystis_antarctica.AAC.29
MASEQGLLLTTHFLLPGAPAHPLAARARPQACGARRARPLPGCIARRGGRAAVSAHQGLRGGTSDAVGLCRSGTQEGGGRGDGGGGGGGVAGGVGGG